MVFSGNDIYWYVVVRLIWTTTQWNVVHLHQGLTPSDKKCFEDMAKADKVRYNREMKDYVPPKGFGKRGRKRKDPNAPKRPP